jgi:hypothetical protein
MPYLQITMYGKTKEVHWNYRAEQGEPPHCSTKADPVGQKIIAGDKPMYSVQTQVNLFKNHLKILKTPHVSPTSTCSVELLNSAQSCATI